MNDIMTYILFLKNICEIDLKCRFFKKQGDEKTLGTLLGFEN